MDPRGLARTPSLEKPGLWQRQKCLLRIVQGVQCCSEVAAEHSDVVDIGIDQPWVRCNLSSYSFHLQRGTNSPDL